MTLRKTLECRLYSLHNSLHGTGSGRESAEQGVGNRDQEDNSSNLLEPDICSHH